MTATLAAPAALPMGKALNAALRRAMEDDEPI